MRACVFSPDLEPLLGGAAEARVLATLGPGTHEIVAVTSSWAEIPPDENVYVTGRARTWSMRVFRRAPSWGSPAGRLTSRLLSRWVAPALLEAFRAADPDVIVCLDRRVARQIGTILDRAHAPWPCIALGEAVAPTSKAFRRYDPSALVSIVLPTYNGTRFLGESIASCLAQSHRQLELIVVDDGSSEEVADLVRSFGDCRIVYLRHDRNQGLPASLNTGFRHARGEFCTWTSDDNRYLPDALAEMVRFLQTYRAVDFVYAESYGIDESGVIDPGRVLRTRPPESLAEDNYIGACFLYRREVYETIGAFSVEAALAEDYDYWVRVSRRFTMQRLFRRLYCYRFHEASLTSRAGRESVARRAEAVRQRAHSQAWSWLR